MSTKPSASKCVCGWSGDKCVCQDIEPHETEPIHGGDDIDAPAFSIPKCPWCGVPLMDWWDMGFDDNTVEVVCGECGHSYNSTMRTRITFTSWRK